MKKTLTPTQKYVLAELERRGLHLIAETTKEAWEHGKTYYLDTRQQRVCNLRSKFKQGNKEAAK